MKDIRNGYNLDVEHYLSSKLFLFTGCHVTSKFLTYPDQEHKNVFLKVPVINFRRAKSLKDILARAKVPLVKKNGLFVDHGKNQEKKSLRTLSVLITLSQQ